MNYKLIFWIISVSSFWGYSIWYFIFHGVPRSWSQTFYNLEKIYKKDDIGYIYTGFLWLSMFSLLPVVMDKYPLLFLPIVLICAVGAAMDSKLSRQSMKVHIFGATGGIATMLIIMALPEKWAGMGQWIYAIPTIILIGLMMWKKTKPKNNTTWIESLAVLVADYVVLITCVL